MSADAEQHVSLETEPLAAAVDPPKSPNHHACVDMSGSAVLTLCLTMWVVLGIVAACIYVAARQVCAQPQLADDACTILVMAGTASSVVTLVACAVCLIGTVCCCKYRPMEAEEDAVSA